MKRILLLLLLCVITFGTTESFAQTKKDGTKDMRYKANKAHLKKDGTPDARYKENRTTRKTTSKTTVTKKTTP